MDHATIDTAVKLVSELLSYKAAHPSHQDTYEHHPWVWNHDLTRFAECFYPFVPDDERESFKRQVLAGVEDRLKSGSRL
jgi:hypothetical protein